MNFSKIYNNLILHIKNYFLIIEINSKYCNINTFDKYEKERKYTKLLNFVYYKFYLTFIVGLLYVFLLNILIKRGRSKNGVHFTNIRCVRIFSENIKNIDEISKNIFLYNIKKDDILYRDSLDKINEIDNKIKYNSLKEEDIILLKEGKYKNDYSDINLLNRNNVYKNDDESFRNYHKTNNNKDKNVNIKSYIYNWELGQKSLIKMLDYADNFYFNGVKYSDWKLTSMRRFNLNNNVLKDHKTYKTIINSKKKQDDKKKVKLFIKKIPIDIWVEQFNLMKEYEGEYLIDKENYVMEAVSLAFLNEYYPGITPKFYKILYESDKKNIKEKNYKKYKFHDLNELNDILTKELENNINGNIVLISEFFGENVFNYIKRKKNNIFVVSDISNEDKKKILYNSLNLLMRLHNAGLTHLDLSPDNMLISPKNYEMRLCDLAQTTPMYTNKLRHKEKVKFIQPFESFEPCIGKIEYIPPECWKIVWKYKLNKIKNPIEYLKNISNQEERKKYYYDVACADKYMLGIFFIWMWNNGFIWKCSDPIQDKIFQIFIRSNMDLNTFIMTKSWPHELNNLINKLLHMDHRKTVKLSDLCTHPWWSSKY
ncbi:serine/threonine protein kinase, FIKK family, putative [Plasmodium gaboni]|uniref:non-specific serine/threonine protein kinase n=1 Tax=Plasmodium gaboni TaxID=647221 RepID=A0ABY1UWF9_9APIC|nr:serine/threonine protein kinase, FIKK family, putative [Plasmodium gaboni]